MGVGSLYSDALWTILKPFSIITLDSYCEYLSSDVTTSFSSLGVVTDDAISQLEHIRIALVSLLCYCQAWNPRGDQAPQNADTSMFHKKIMYTNNLQDADSLHYFSLRLQKFEKDNQLLTNALSTSPTITK